MPRLPFLSPLLLTAIALMLMPPYMARASEATGLPLPRFVSLRSEEVNIRTGPGTRYPVDWIYRRKDIPVEIIAEFDAWRKIRDWQGTEGWLHQSMVSGNRMMVVTGEMRKLRAKDDDQAKTLALVEPGVIGRLEHCPVNNAFCQIKIHDIEGWLRRDEFWGVYKGESIE